MLGCMSTRKNGQSGARLSLDQHLGRSPGKSPGDATATQLLPSEGVVGRCCGAGRSCPVTSALAGLVNSLRGLLKQPGMSVDLLIVWAFLTGKEGLLGISTSGTMKPLWMS